MGANLSSARQSFTVALAGYAGQLARWQAEAGQLPTNAKKLILKYQHFASDPFLGTKEDKMLIDLEAAVNIYTELLRAKLSK